MDLGSVVYHHCAVTDANSNKKVAKTMALRNVFVNQILDKCLSAVVVSIFEMQLFSTKTILPSVEYMGF